MCSCHERPQEVVELCRTNVPHLVLVLYSTTAFQFMRDKNNEVRFSKRNGPRVSDQVFRQVCKMAEKALQHQVSFEPALT